MVFGGERAGLGQGRSSLVIAAQIHQCPRPVNFDPAAQVLIGSARSIAPGQIERGQRRRRITACQIRIARQGPEPGAFDERLVLSDVVEVYESVLDFADLRILNTAALTSTLSGKLSLKLSHSLIFDNVPVEGFEPLDQTSMVTLVASLL